MKLPIPIAVPIYVGEPKTSGRTNPLQMRCEVLGKGEFVDVVVKLWANPEMHLGKHCLAREVYGSILARLLGLMTPDIFFIDIEPDFYESQPPDKSEVLRQSLGLNFGSKFIPGAQIFSPPVQSSKHSEAVRIFCFDMLIGNPDRRVNKPNVFQMANGYIVFDHEQAFPFSRPQMLLGGYPPSWFFIKESWHNNHIFFSDIRNRDCSSEIEDFITSVGFLSDFFLDTIEEQIPGEWCTDDELLNIRHYLIATRENSELFKRSLQEILA